MLGGVGIVMMNIGFISTRFCGTDGVTLETSKWAQVFQRNGYPCFWFAGELDRDPSTSYLAPEAHFLSEVNQEINDAVVGSAYRMVETSDLIHAQSQILKRHLYRFLQKFDIDVVVAENILSLPMQIPLGLALTEVIAETQIPTIAHHHDFYWERDRYLVNGVGDHLQGSFPPKLNNIAHMVINTAAREELSRRCGIMAMVVPNVLDFHHPPKVDMDAARSFRDYIGVKADDLVVLQPTRVVQRKGIEHAINLVHALGRPNAKLVISHQAGDEGFEYAKWLKTFARSLNVDLMFVETHLDDPWGTYGRSHSRKFPEFSLYDVYPGANFVTYPSLCEGFGNGLLEAIYFKKPVLVNRYATYVTDIEPLGFDLVSIDGFLTQQAVERVNQLIDSPHLRRQMTGRNYNIARTHYSYQNLQDQLNGAMTQLLGDNYSRLDADMNQPAQPEPLTPRGREPVAEQDMNWARSFN
jgi:glycosyltransferase involved in cell wall biosynthesis